jgi:lipoprotein-anchoring transpeptidase ErfK/SrfK
MLSLPSDEQVQGTSMQRLVVTALFAGALGTVPAFADPLPLSPDNAKPMRVAAAQSNLGGGFLEFLANGGSQAPTPRGGYPADPHYARQEPADQAAGRAAMDPRYQRQVVDYDGKERAGTIIIDTPRRFLFLVQGNGKAMRYGIGVGRPGFTWAGVKHVSAKREWPDWRPPDEMLKRRPDLPRHMAGGPENPLGARAMYLGNTLYRIHGSNEPWTIGTQVSSGCIRMRNEDVIDLYNRVKVGSRVVVI